MVGSGVSGSHHIDAAAVGQLSSRGMSWMPVGTLERDSKIAGWSVGSFAAKVPDSDTPISARGCNDA